MTAVEPLTRTARGRLAATATAVQAHLGATDLERTGRIRELLETASNNLASADIGRTISVLLALNHAEELTQVLGADFDSLDHASLSLGVEDTATAIDLCAATGAVATARITPPHGGRLEDLESWHPTVPGFIAWRNGVLEHDTYRVLLAWRHHLVHRDPARLRRRMAATDPAFVGTVPEYQYPSAWRVWASPADPPFELRSPRDLDTVIDFGVERVMAFCDALLDTLSVPAS